MGSTRQHDLTYDLYVAIAHNAADTPRAVFDAALALGDHLNKPDKPVVKHPLPSPVDKPKTKTKAATKPKKRTRVAATAGLNTDTRDLSRANRAIAECLEANRISYYAVAQAAAAAIGVDVSDLPGTIKVLIRLRTLGRDGSAMRVTEVQPHGMTSAYTRACLNYLLTRNYAHRTRLNRSAAYAWTYTNPSDRSS